MNLFKLLVTDEMILAPQRLSLRTVDSSAGSWLWRAITHICTHREEPKRLRTMNQGRAAITRRLMKSQRMVKSDFIYKHNFTGGWAAACVDAHELRGLTPHPKAEFHNTNTCNK